MESQCFQEKQISYLLQRRAKWDKTSKITRSKSLKTETSDWGTQTTLIKCETSQALPPQISRLLKSFQTAAHTHRHFEACSLQNPSNSYLQNGDYSIWSLPVHLNWQRKKWHCLIFFFLQWWSWPHLKAVAIWGQKPFSSVTTETNIETLVICYPVFSRKFTYELHTKFLWSDKLFWTCMKKTVLLHYRPPLAILCCLYKKTVHLKPASIVVSLSLALSLRIETDISMAFRFPVFSARHACLLATVMCVNINTVICTRQEIIWRDSVDSQRHKELHKRLMFKTWPQDPNTKLFPIPFHIC